MSCHFLPPGDLFNPGVRPLFLALAGGIFTTEQPVKVKWKWMSLSPVQLFARPWATQSMEFSSPEYWSGQSFPSPGDLPNPGIELRSPALQADSLPAELQRKSKLLDSGCNFSDSDVLRVGMKASQPLRHLSQRSYITGLRSHSKRRNLKFDSGLWIPSSALIHSTTLPPFFKNINLFILIGG